MQFGGAYLLFYLNLPSVVNMSCNQMSLSFCPYKHPSHLRMIGKLYLHHCLCKSNPFWLEVMVGSTALNRSHILVVNIDKILRYQTIDTVHTEYLNITMYPQHQHAYSKDSGQTG